MFEEFPKWKYAQGEARIVEDADEEAALNGDWYDTPGDVPEKTEVGQNPALEVLRASATAMGIVIDKRWGAQRLEDEIKAKILAEGEHPDASHEDPLV